MTEKVGVPTDRTRLDVLGDVFEGFNPHDPDTIMSHFVDDCVFGSPRGPDPWGRRFDGREAAHGAPETRFTGIPDVSYEGQGDVVSGERGVSEWTLRGTTVEGRRLEVRGFGLWAFRGDRIVRKDSYWKTVEP